NKHAHPVRKERKNFFLVYEGSLDRNPKHMVGMKVCRMPESDKKLRVERQLFELAMPSAEVLVHRLIDKDSEEQANQELRPPRWVESGKRLRSSSPIVSEKEEAITGLRRQSPHHRPEVSLKLISIVVLHCFWQTVLSPRLS
ncbi:MAG: hypothetical protein ACLFO5_03380, partial [Opitutales bacterium]